MSVPVVTPLDPRAYALLAEDGFGPELFNPTQHAACELVEAYATALAGRLCRDLGLAEMLHAPRRLEEMRAEVTRREERIRQLTEELERLKQIDLRRRRPAAPLP